MGNKQTSNIVQRIKFARDINLPNRDVRFKRAIYRKIKTPSKSRIIHIYTHIYVYSFFHRGNVHRVSQSKTTINRGSKQNFIAFPFENEFSFWMDGEIIGGRGNAITRMHNPAPSNKE